jgi:hypothetical protein
MCRLRGACPIVVFDKLPDDPPNVGGAKEDEVVERIFTQRAMESLDARIRVRSVVRRGQLSVPKTRFSWDHGHLSRPVPSRGMPRPGGGLRVAVSADAVEQRQRHG